VGGALCAYGNAASLHVLETADRQAAQSLAITLPDPMTACVFKRAWSGPRSLDLLSAPTMRQRY